MEFDEDRQAFLAIDEQVTQLTADLTRAVAKEIRDAWPVRTGKSRRTIVSYGNRIFVGDADTQYWKTVEFGSRPHRIVPRTSGMGRGNRRKEALYWPGANHPVAAVDHPGTPEQAIIRRTLYGWRDHPWQR
jgi:hypothetical protein